MDGTAHPTAWTGTHVLVAGARRTGASVVDVLLELGATVTIADADPEQLASLADRKTALTTDLASLPEGTGLVVTSPGFRPDSPLARAALAAGVEMIGEPELAWRLGHDPAVCPDGPPRWLAVTGTNGKTTTTGMLEAILLAAGEDAVACGNIGLPIVDALRAGHRVLAVELSSFQLEWSPSVAPHAGAVLNVADDHLDWHGSMAAYAAAKARVLRGEIAIAGLDDERAAGLLRDAPAPRRVGFTRGEPSPGEVGLRRDEGLLLDRAFPDEGDRRGTVLATLGDVAPAGPPGEANALAAAALARAHGVPAAAVAAGLRAYAPGAHRGAVVAEANGVRWLDDSKATNPHAAAASLAAHDRVVWLAGGILKGAHVDDLVIAHRGRLAGVVVLGVDRGAILDALARHAPEVPVVDVGAGDDGPMDPDPMGRAAAAAASMARPGDVVLLAPAAASMDMFRDYAARGDAFAAAAQRVAGLPEPASDPGAPA
ncbi:UDP-N-acetylmuramoyl-L-alanine--D-glutamate ligase [Actinomycetospora sp. TBRC 11914]|uniref:UDP-N-acetylmuramoyl-L-alanine--D-glutamate ligase n=1 Tax=Actinomycetospora sp. TBRC 11914 TaxID=2729387 RepID=UPI00145F3902|nr:UDP-N-acetylmuramoyl-L-alanine--D-glutamate ligase [Actinomycetospora sp. TBRC 11914]NMO93316.1 UDP-N-acetylmuramoyl-L-alanine--D-glutamate ligase [Actinomycetospora sp. TBRC 11914]